MPNTINALLLGHEVPMRTLETRIGHHFQDQTLLLRALTHSSYAFEHPYVRHHNETLEFLGDSVLDLAMGTLLVTHFPDLREGKLSRIRSAVVNEHWLAKMAEGLGLPGALLLGRGEESTGGREKSSITSSAYEALLGAMYLDGGFDVAFSFVQGQFSEALETQREELLCSDPKSGLQEFLQGHGKEGPSYTLLSEEGPAHARVFTVSVSCQGEELGQGQAGSKKAAEQEAARQALARLADNA